MDEELIHLERVVSRGKGGKKPTFSCEKTSAEREEDLKRATAAQSHVSANRSSICDPRRISMLEKVSSGSLQVKRPTVHPSDGRPEAESAAALHQRVSLVHSKLQSHINNEERMQSLNKDLREKLELYIQQHEARAGQEACFEPQEGREPLAEEESGGTHRRPGRLSDDNHCSTAMEARDISNCLGDAPPSISAAGCGATMDARSEACDPTPEETARAADKAAKKVAVSEYETAEQKFDRETAEFAESQCLLKERAAELEKEKDELQVIIQRQEKEFESERSKLEDHLLDMNVDLNEQLEARKQITLLQAQLENTLEVKNKLEENLLSFSEQTRYLNVKAEQYSDQLRTLIVREQKDKEIMKRGNRVLLRRAFLNFQEAIREQCIAEANEITALEFYASNTARRGIRALREATNQACQLRYQSMLEEEEDEEDNRVQECWEAWRSSVSGGDLGNNDDMCESHPSSGSDEETPESGVFKRRTRAVLNSQKPMPPIKPWHLPKTPPVITSSMNYTSMGSSLLPPFATC